jgi:hypothetical protein
MQIRGKNHVRSLDEFTEKDMQDEYTKHMDSINWPNLLLQPRREREQFGPDMEADKEMKGELR